MNTDNVEPLANVVNIDLDEEGKKYGKDQLYITLETAHPAKFTETVEQVIGVGKVELPEKLAAFMKGKKQIIPLKRDYMEFRSYLFENA